MLNLFLQSLEVNKSLAKLALNKCKLNTSLTQLATSLMRNNTLKEICLWGNNFNQDTCKMFHKLFRDHNRESNSTRKYIVSDILKTDFELYMVDSVYLVAEISNKH